GMGVADGQRAERAHPVDVLRAGGVPHVAAEAAHQRGRVAAHRPVRPDRAVHTAGEELQRLLDHAGAPDARGVRPPLPEPPLWSGTLGGPTVHPSGSACDAPGPGKTDPLTRAKPLLDATS